MCAGGRLSGSQPPARVLKSHLWNWFHGPFGRAQRLSGAKENAGPYLGRGPAKLGDHSSPKEQPRADLLTLGGKRKAEPGSVD
jgi:hypothetical protein